MQRRRPRPRSDGYRVPFDVGPYVPSILARSRKNVDKDVEQYEAWGGGGTLPMWTDVQGWHEATCVMTEAPGTSNPLWLRKILRGQKKLTDIAPVPLLGA